MSQNSIIFRNFADKSAKHLQTMGCVVLRLGGVSDAIAVTTRKDSNNFAQNGLFYEKSHNNSFVARSTTRWC